MSDGADERARIIDAAYRCLADSNGAFVSITDILAAAGISTRAFYRHFGSKDDLLLAMWRDDSVKVMAELRTSVTSAGSAREMLRRWIHGMLRLTSEEPRRRRVLVLASAEVRRTRGYSAEYARLQAAHEAAIVEILRHGQADGSFPRAKPLADARAIQAVLGQAFDAQLREEGANAGGAADEAADFVLRALGAPPFDDDSGAGHSDCATARRPDGATSTPH